MKSTKNLYPNKVTFYSIRQMHNSVVTGALPRLYRNHCQALFNASVFFPLGQFKDSATKGDAVCPVGFEQHGLGTFFPSPRHRKAIMKAPFLEVLILTNQKSMTL